MSPTATSITGAINIAIGAIPSILALVRAKHAAANPGAPALTDADVFAALAYAVASSVAIDDRWQAAHPPDQDAGPPQTIDEPQP